MKRRVKQRFEHLSHGLLEEAGVMASLTELIEGASGTVRDEE